MTRRDLRLWLLVLAGPAAWALDLNLSYALSPEAHAHASVLDLHLVHAGAFVVAAIAAVIGGRELHRLLGAGDDAPTSRARFMAAAAVALSLLAIVLVIGNAIPTFMLDPGAEP